LVKCHYSGGCDAPVRIRSEASGYRGALSALGARFALAISVDPDRERNLRRVEDLCNEAAQRNMTIALEFMKFMSSGSLPDALDVLLTVNHPASSLLLDTLHFYRCGYGPAELGSIDPNLLQYAQICDGPAQLKRSGDDALIPDALFDREQVGEGELPVNEFVGGLPEGIPLSIEMRSARV